MWHPKGAIVRKLIEDYSRLRHERGGYSFVYTPHLTNGKLFETCGHLGFYADGMYPPMEMDNGTYYPKPMNCPMHCLIFGRRQRSYRELPLRLFELGTVYRYERAGTLHGLMRIRGFTQDDSHIFCTEEQMAGEVASLLDFVLSVLRAFGFDDFTFNLSTKDPNKYVGSDEMWDRATTRFARRSTRTASSTASRRATPRSTARRSTSTSAMRSDGRGSCRRSRPTSTTRSGSTSSTSAPTTPGTARSCCTGRCSVRSNGSSACCSSTTPGRSRRGWRPSRSSAAGRRGSRGLRQAGRGCVGAAGMRVNSAPPTTASASGSATAKMEKIPYVLVVGDDDVEAKTVGVNPRGGEVVRGVPLDRFVADSRRGRRGHRRGGHRVVADVSTTSGRVGGRRTSPATWPTATPRRVRAACSPRCSVGSVRRRDPHRPSGSDTASRS